MGFSHYEHRTGRNRQSLSRALATPSSCFLRRSGQPSVFSRNEGPDEAKPRTACDDDTSRLVKPACVRISTFLHARRQDSRAFDFLLALVWHYGAANTRLTRLR